jgi:hypothetical protein
MAWPLGFQVWCSYREFCTTLRRVVGQQPPICSWWTSRVSPSCMSSCVVSAIVSGNAVSRYRRKTAVLPHTVSGLSAAVTRWPSNRNRTLEMFFPWRSQKAFMSLPRAVVRLILKKTSLLLSVTLMLRCSLWPPSSGFCCTLGEPLSDILRCRVLVGVYVGYWVAER